MEKNTLTRLNGTIPAKRSEVPIGVKTKKSTQLVIGDVSVCNLKNVESKI